MEAFARTLEAWDRVRSAEDPYPYVRRVVVNLSRSRLRRLAVVRRTRLDAPDEPPAPEGTAVATESRTELIRALNALPVRQRECVVLRYLEDCSTAETADALGISEGSVKTHLHRALRSLEEALKETR